MNENMPMVQKNMWKKMKMHKNINYWWVRRNVLPLQPQIRNNTSLIKKLTS